MRKGKKCTTPGFEPATLNSTGTAYRLKVESHVPYNIPIADFYFDDLIVAALVHARSLRQFYCCHMYCSLNCATII